MAQFYQPDRDRPDPYASAPRYKRTTAYSRAYHQTVADWYQATPDLDDHRNIRDIKSVLAHILAKYPVEESAYPQEVLNEAWKQSVGDFVAKTSCLESISRDVATVKVLHPTVRFQLVQNERSILIKLQNTLGDKNLKKIIFNLG